MYRPEKNEQLKIRNTKNRERSLELFLFLGPLVLLGGYNILTNKIVYISQQGEIGMHMYTNRMVDYVYNTLYIIIHYGIYNYMWLYIMYKIQ